MLRSWPMMMVRSDSCCGYPRNYISRSLQRSHYNIFTNQGQCPMSLKLRDQINLQILGQSKMLSCHLVTLTCELFQEACKLVAISSLEKEHILYGTIKFNARNMNQGNIDWWRLIFVTQCSSGLVFKWCDCHPTMLQKVVQPYLHLNYAWITVGWMLTTSTRVTSNVYQSRWVGEL